MPTVTQEEAIANLPRLIDDVVEQGGEIVVTRDRIAIARIVPVADPAIPDTAVSNKHSRASCLVATSATHF